MPRADGYLNLRSIQYSGNEKLSFSMNETSQGDTMFTGSLMKRFVWSSALLLSLFTMTALTLRAEDPASADSPVATQSDAASAEPSAPDVPAADQPSETPSEEVSVEQVSASDFSLEENKSNGGALLIFSLVVGKVGS